MGGVEYQVTKVDPTDPETKGMVYQVHKVSEEIAATLGGKVYRARIINDPTDPTVAGKVYQIVLIGDPDDPAVKGKVYNAILTGGSEAVVVGPAVSPLALPDAIANTLSYVKAFGGTEQNGTPTPDTPVDIVSNNGVLKARHQSGLPLGYTALDYVSFDGVSSSGAYVDTGIEFYNQIPNNKIRIKAKAKVYNQSSWQVICGNLGFVSAYTGINPENKIAYGFGSNDAITDVVNPEVLCVFDLDLVSGTYKVTNTSTGVDIVNITEIVPVASTNVRNILLGGYNNSSGTIINNRTKMDFESAEIYNDGVLVSKLIPCKNSSNVVGCYDVVRDVFLTNIVGSTNLVAGSTVSDPVEIYTDGTVETINAHGKNLFGDPTWGSRLNDDGTSISTESMFVSQFISVKPNTTYTFSYISGVIGQYRRICGYNNKTETSFTALIAKINRPSGGVGGEYITISFTTDTNTNYIRVSGFNSDTQIQIELGSTATEYQPYYDGGTATAEMLLKVGDYQDEQEILSGAVTRKVGIKVFDGTEGWVKGTSFYADISLGALQAAHSCICNYYAGKSTNPYSADSNTIQVGYNGGSLTFWNRVYITANRAEYATAADFKAYLAAQYAAGTPVIVLYPLATPTTESVTGQTLQVTAGDNILEITQASMSGLELEAEYEKEAE